MRIRKFFIPRHFTFSFFIAKYNGSISAEHGLGFKKANYIHYSKSSSSVALMKEIKGLLDPKVNAIQLFAIFVYLIVLVFGLEDWRLNLV